MPLGVISFALTEARHGAAGDFPTDYEAAKGSLNEQKHIAKRRKAAEAEKTTRQLLFPNPGGSVSLCEIVCFSHLLAPWAAIFRPPPDGLGGAVREPPLRPRRKNLTFCLNPLIGCSRGWF
jgi:hypothetical protein